MGPAHAFLLTKIGSASRARSVVTHIPRVLVKTEVEQKTQMGIGWFRGAVVEMLEHGSRGVSGHGFRTHKWLLSSKHM